MTVGTVGANGGTVSKRLEMRGRQGGIEALNSRLIIGRWGRTSFTCWWREVYSRVVEKWKGTGGKWHALKKLWEFFSLNWDRGDFKDQLVEWTRETHY